MMSSPSPFETPARRRVLARAMAVDPAPAAAGLHTISLLVRDAPGVLVRVAMVFSRRGYNIESLVVSASAENGFSRMTVTCSLGFVVSASLNAWKSSTDASRA